MIDINVDLEHEGTRVLWRAIGELVSVLPKDWVLIGGLMVQLHALEHGHVDLRVIDDVDLRLAFDEPAALDPRIVRRASQAYRLLLTAD